jgi:WD40 repeat protein
MDLLSDDIFHHIISFLPSCVDLGNLSVTNWRAFSYIHQSHCANPIFKTLWQKQYNNMYHSTTTTREDDARRSFQSLYYYPQFVKSNAPKNHLKGFRKLGILSPTQERAALLYENGDEEANCMGYFGMQLLWEDLVVVWGDFQGIRLLSGGIQGLLHDHNDDHDDTNNREVVLSIGEEESHVLTILCLPDQKIIFLGFSSGKVWSIQAITTTITITTTTSDTTTTTTTTKQYSYRCVSSAMKHTNEVTSLCFLPEDGGLLSASVDGNVYKYPNATTMHGSLDNAICLFEVGNPVLTMSAIDHRGRTYLVTGDQGAYVSLWWQTTTIDDWQHSFIRLDNQNVPTETLLWLDGRSDLYVIVGDNGGRLLCWRLDDHLELELMGSCVVNTNNILTTTQQIECFAVCGNLLLVANGRKTTVFSLPDGVRHSIPKLIGSPLSSHPRSQRYASVVSCFLCHDRQSLVTLCRDGTLHEWNYNNNNNKRDVSSLLRKKKLKRGYSEIIETEDPVVAATLPLHYDETENQDFIPLDDDQKVVVADPQQQKMMCRNNNNNNNNNCTNLNSMRSQCKSKRSSIVGVKVDLLQPNQPGRSNDESAAHAMSQQAAEKKIAAVSKQQKIAAVSKQQKIAAVWSCLKCTFLNKVRAISCEVCSTAKTREGQTAKTREGQPAKTREGQPAKTRAISTATVRATVRTREGQTATVRAAAKTRAGPTATVRATAKTRPTVRAAVVSEWSCRMCTFLNKVGAGSCEVCSTVRAGSTARTRANAAGVG